MFAHCKSGLSVKLFHTGQRTHHSSFCLWPVAAVHADAASQVLKRRLKDIQGPATVEQVCSPVAHSVVWEVCCQLSLSQRCSTKVRCLDENAGQPVTSPGSACYETPISQGALPLLELLPDTQASCFCSHALVTVSGPW